MAYTKHYHVSTTPWRGSIERLRWDGCHRHERRHGCLPTLGLAEMSFPKYPSAWMVACLGFDHEWGMKMEGPTEYSRIHSLQSYTKCYDVSTTRWRGSIEPLQRDECRRHQKRHGCLLMLGLQECLENSWKFLMPTCPSRNARRHGCRHASALLMNEERKWKGLLSTLVYTDYSRIHHPDILWACPCLHQPSSKISQAAKQSNTGSNMGPPGNLGPMYGNIRKPSRHENGER